MKLITFFDFCFSEPEVQIIDFVTQQYKLFPPLAFVLAVCYASRALEKEYLEVAKSIEKGNVDTLPMVCNPKICFRLLSQNVLR